METSFVSAVVPPTVSDPVGCSAVVRSALRAAAPRWHGAVILRGFLMASGLLVLVVFGVGLFMRILASSAQGPQFGGAMVLILGAIALVPMLQGVRALAAGL